MRKVMLGLAAMLLIVSAKIAAAQTEYQGDFKGYDSHIDPDGKLHCLNPGTKCISW